MEEKLYKIPEVAQILGVSVSKTRTLLKSGKLKYINISEGEFRKCYRIPTRFIEEFKTNAING